MGLVIFVLLVGIVVAILLTPALQERARKRREALKDTVHEAVVRRLDDHRRGGPKPPGGGTEDARDRPKDKPGEDGDR